MQVLFAMAGENYWTPAKPYGADIIDIDIDPQNPNILYTFCNYAGIYKSSDAGESWTKISKDIKLKPTAYGDLEIDPTDSYFLYFTDDNYLYKSIDGGESWKLAMEGLEKSKTVDIDINPFNHYELTAATIYNGVKQSIDGGDFWEYLNFIYLSNYVVEYDNVTPNLIYAGSLLSPTWDRPNGFFKSQDNGIFWREQRVGMDDLHMFEDIEIDPSNNQIIYIAGIGAYNYPQDFPDAKPYHCIYKTENQGDTWICINNGLEINEAKTIKVHPDFPNIVYVCSEKKGIMKSVDAGQSWQQSNNNLTGISANKLVIDKTNNIFYLGTRFNGIFKSTDNGASWQDCNKGLHGLNITVIEFNPKNSKTIYIGKFGQPYKSIDGGLTWQRLGMEMLSKVNTYDLKVDPVDTSIVYLGTMTKFLTSRDTTKDRGFFISFDGGQTWQKRNNGMLDDVDVLCLDVHVKKDRRTLYLGTTRGVYTSSDLGEHWQSINNGINDPYLITQTIHVVKEDSNTVYASFPTGVYKTKNGGDSWENISQGISGLGFYCFVDPNNSKRIVLTCTTSAPQSNDGGAFYSVDSGENWTKFDNGEYFSFAFDTNNSNRMLIGGLGIVKFSENGFENFEEISHGLDHINDWYGINCISFHPDSVNKFYLSIPMLGLFSYSKTSSPVAEHNIKTRISFQFKLHQNYPNPFNAKTKIRYEISKPGFIVLNIYNLSGEKISTLVRESKQAGKYIVVWNGELNNGKKAASGIYFYELVYGDQKQVKKTILLQ